MEVIDRNYESGKLKKKDTRTRGTLFYERDMEPVWRPKALNLNHFNNRQTDV